MLRWVAFVWVVGVTVWLLVAPVYDGGLTSVQVNGPTAVIGPIVLGGLMTALAFVSKDHGVGVVQWTLLGVATVAVALSAASFGLFYLPALLLLAGYLVIRAARVRRA